MSRAPVWSLVLPAQKEEAPKARASAATRVDIGGLQARMAILGAPLGCDSLASLDRL